MKHTRFAQESAAQAQAEAQEKQAQHTPGPWLIRTNGWQVTDADDGLVAVTHDDTSQPGLLPHSEAVANARLIAAAPELLEAAQKAQNAIQRVAGINDENRLGWALQDLDAAIAKATNK